MLKLALICLDSQLEYILEDKSNCSLFFNKKSSEFIKITPSRVTLKNGIIIDLIVKEDMYKRKYNSYQFVMISFNPPDDIKDKINKTIVYL